jgi:hypothetical protein
MHLWHASVLVFGADVIHPVVILSDAKDLSI